MTLKNDLTTGDFRHYLRAGDILIPPKRGSLQGGSTGGAMGGTAWPIVRVLVSQPPGLFIDYRLLLFLRLTAPYFPKNTYFSRQFKGFIAIIPPLIKNN